MNDSTTPPYHQKKTDIQGHRGCRGLMPENSIPAMFRALQIGVTTLEMDVAISKDSQVLLSHEPFMSKDISIAPDGSSPDANTEKSFNLYRMNYSEIRQWDVGSKYHPLFPQQEKIKVSKPLLAELIDSVEHYIRTNKLSLVQYNIETKMQPSSDGIFHPEPAEFVRLLMKVLADKKLENRVIIQSFDPRSLQIIHRNYPGIKTALLVSAAGQSAAQRIAALGFKPDIFSPEFRLVNENMVTYCRSEGILLIPWTVNNQQDMQKLIALGVDGLITDYPDRAMKF